MLGHFQRYVIKYAAPLTVAELAAAARHDMLMQLPGKRGIGTLLPQEEKDRCAYYSCVFNVYLLQAQEFDQSMRSAWALISLQFWRGQNNAGAAAQL